MPRRERRSFTPEFKARTVALIESSGKSIAEICRELDLTQSAVCHWGELARVDRGEKEGRSSDERAETVTGFVERALAFYASYGITAKRLMTDNAWTYTKNSSLKGLLQANDIRHLRTKPYRPQTNGKIERFHQTMGREWAYGMTYASARARAHALPY